MSATSPQGRHVLLPLLHLHGRWYEKVEEADRTELTLSSSVFHRAHAETNS